MKGTRAVGLLLVLSRPSPLQTEIASCIDLDGDGKAELVTSDSARGTLTVHANHTAGRGAAPAFP